MKRKILAVALFSMFAVATSAFADQGGEGNNTGCNGQGNVNSPCAPGGTGGNGGNAQSQYQDQSQGQSQTASGTATAFNNNVNVTNASAVSNASGGAGGNANVKNSGNSSATSSSGVSQSGNSAVKNAGNNTGTANVVVQGDQAQARDPVSSASAPTVYTGNDQCLVAVAAGGQAVGFGFSVGTAIPDKNCENLKLFRTLWTIGLQRQALLLLACNEERVRKVMGIPKEMCEEQQAE